MSAQQRRVLGWATLAAVNVPALVIDWRIGLVIAGVVIVPIVALFSTAWLSALYGSNEVSKRAFHLIFLLFGRTFDPSEDGDTPKPSAHGPQELTQSEDQRAIPAPREGNVPPSGTRSKAECQDELADADNEAG